jgi:hypothetical protein
VARQIGSTQDAPLQLTLRWHKDRYQVVSEASRSEAA